MKFTTTLALAIATLVVATPTPDEGVDAEPRKGCSGKRLETEVCGGKKLGPQHSFHNCKNRGGKCCAIKGDGSGGIDVTHGQGREDCGYCFSGKCSA